MRGHFHIIRRIFLALAIATLGGCVAGPVAQQLASSIILRGADKITADAYEAQQRQDREKGITLKDTVPDEYYAAFISSGFETSHAASATNALPEQPQAPAAQPLPARIESSRLVRVELWNLLVGDEKHAVLEKAYLLGSSSVPPVGEWDEWQVATGASQATANKPITFLIPPEFGRVRTGGNAVVEIAEQGGLHRARYLLNTPSASVRDQSALIASQ